MTQAIKQAAKLQKDIQTKLRNWNERSQFKLKGVGNLSRADLDSLDRYAKAFVQSGGTEFRGMMKPLGNVGEVLEKYGITPSTVDMW